MKREIKFRGWNAKNKRWIYGFYLQNRGAHFVCPDEFANDKTWEDYEVDPETVGQFTGLHDKNGKEVYEGDIIKGKEAEYKHLIRYDLDRAGFVATLTNYLNDTISESFWTCGLDKKWIDEFHKVVIGNIHDNPELMKGKTE